MPENEEETPKRKYSEHVFSDLTITRLEKYIDNLRISHGLSEDALKEIATAVEKEKAAMKKRP